MDEDSGGFTVGDRVRMPNGTAGTVVKPPRYYEIANGDPFTGWGVVVEEDIDPQISLNYIERGFSAGPRSYARVAGLVLIDH